MPSAPEAPSARFAFRTPPGSPTAPGEAALSALLPILFEPLTGGGLPVAADGLLDTGASISVLPYGLGLALGAAWPERAAAPLRLGGNLAGYEAHALLLTARVADFAPVRLAFAWTRAERVPLILGQVSFFLEFDVCFFRSRQLFEVRPKHA